jgi:1,4-alpha-glucan branching enzyme
MTRLKPFPTDTYRREPDFKKKYYLRRENMVSAKFIKKPKRRRVRFSYGSPEAKEVILMGDFNRWDPKVHSMKKDEVGVWRKTLMLYPGRYEYRFLVDGKWENDPQNEAFCLNCFGTQNNVIAILPK